MSERPIGPARVRAIALLLPFVVYLAGAALLGDWIIDDAGISYAYARNAAAGHGLVSQPGRPPVEGFSNFLWVVLLMPLLAIGAFDPIWTPKVLGALLVLGAFAIVQRALRRATGSDVQGLLVTLLVAACPPVVIWTASGLENALTLLLVAALYATAVERPGRWQMRCGAIAGLLAMTRPDGLLFAGLGVLLAAAGLARGERPRAVGEELAAHGLGFGAVFVPFLLFRLSVFGLPLPHTYYAKRIHASFGDSLAAMARDPSAAVAKLADVCRGFGGPPGPALVAGTALLAVVLAVRGKLPRHAAIAAALQAIALGGYVWMDPDWMGEYRFATGAALLSSLAFVVVTAAGARAIVEDIARRPGKAPARSLVPWFERARRVALPLSGAALVAGAIASSFPRVVKFASNPPTPFNDVERSFARKLDRYADLLGIGQGSVLLPDVGATLYASRLTVYDAAGLCEPDVIRTLKKGTPVWLDAHPEFYEYVFEELRPTFISTHHFWTLVTAFDDDPRFARDYVAIDAYEDEYVKRVFGRRLRSGDFVRRDALADFGAIDRLRALHRPPPRPDPLVLRLADAAATQPAGGAEAVRELRAAATRARYEDDNPHRAATLLARLLERSPGDLDAALQRASALDAAARPDEARREWERVRDLAPSGASPHFVLARARLEGRFFPARSAP